MLSQETRNEIIRLLHAGVRNKDIARMAGVDNSTISHYKRAEGLIKKPSHSRMPERITQKAVEYTKRGMSSEWICFELGMSKETLARIRKENGLHTAKPGRKKSVPYKYTEVERPIPEIKAVKCASGARFV